MIPGLRYWILIWYGLLLLGVVGLGGALYWGWKTHWKNLEEVFRGVGTISVAAGMLLLLYRIQGGLGEGLLLLAVVCFVLALMFGRTVEWRPHD